MYQSRYIVPNNRQFMYPNSTSNNQDERFLAPFLLGGIAGTAIGYGFGNNNNNYRPVCPGPYCMGPVYPVPYNNYQYVPSYNQNFYY